MKLLKEHKVYQHLGDGRAALYICFERIDDRMYAVQQREEFAYPTAAAAISLTAEINARTLELFAEDSPTSRCRWYGSLEAAITAHNEDFENC